MKSIKHIICYSGGHSSALVAIEVVKKYGNENVILLNHNISSNVENEDIKRFKMEIAAYLKLPITYANNPKWEIKDQFDICIDAKGFKFGNNVMCTYLLKTLPFEKYLTENFADKNCILYYGFDKNEIHRIQRRSSILGEKGYKTDYPLALWNRTIETTNEIGIKPPNTYSVWKHANCTGCLKAGKQHWYLVYLHRPDIWEKAKKAEDELGYSIIKNIYLNELEEDFKKLKQSEIQTTEHEDGRTFMARARKVIKIENEDSFTKPCECFF
jgi:hypothetical protein